MKPVKNQHRDLVLLHLFNDQTNRADAGARSHCDSLESVRAHRQPCCCLPSAADADSAEQPPDSLPRDWIGFSHRPGIQRPLHGAGHQDRPRLR